MRNTYKYNELRKHKFYQIPKQLLGNTYYNDLSSNAKLLYGILLDRMELSRDNEWINESGEIYLIFTRENIAKLLNISKPTAIKAFKELRDKKLIFEEKQGFDKPNKIYIGKIDYNKGKNIDLNKKFSTGEDVEMTGKLNSFTTESKESLPLEVKNLYPNNTDFNNTNLNNTKSKQASETVNSNITIEEQIKTAKEETAASLAISDKSKELFEKAFNRKMNDYEKNKLKSYNQTYLAEAINEVIEQGLSLSIKSPAKYLPCKIKDYEDGIKQSTLEAKEKREKELWEKNIKEDESKKKFMQKMFEQQHEEKILDCIYEYAEHISAGEAFIIDDCFNQKEKTHIKEQAYIVYAIKEVAKYFEQKLIADGVKITFRNQLDLPKTFDFQEDKFDFSQFKDFPIIEDNLEKIKSDAKDKAVNNVMLKQYKDKKAQ